MTDNLIEAVKNLEAAVDDYTAVSYRKAHKAQIGGTPKAWATALSTLKNAVVEASTAVAMAMTDADVSIVSSKYAEVVIPTEIRDSAADAEMGSLRALRARRIA